MFLYVVLFVLVVATAFIARTALYVSKLQRIASHDYYAFSLFIAGHSLDWNLSEVKPEQKQGHTFRLVFVHFEALKVCYLTYIGGENYNNALRKLIESWYERNV